MFLEIITPEKKVFEGEVDSAKFPGSKGEFQVLNDHAPLISPLGKGLVTYKDGDEVKELLVDGGVVEVLHNKIIVLAESAQA
ncbi:ATP synthase F1 subunit epsilon [Xanthovirga aplysinae]|uniref:ATP synthase F1 subunit epsilon n=1 Tax=Xanthovirga aplysinae TaxID=2529853 RepID=UPI0012BB641E|nr:ATP synthase F1 subunit epsilon [Xanthovirga aplysinae]MTI32348.1 ATP synthase F1 subunit epsilon [Xanthovirga aplysinae]